MAEKRNLVDEISSGVSRPKELPATLSGSDVIGSQNSARLKMYEDIAENADLARQDEVNGVEDTRDPNRPIPAAPIKSMGPMIDGDESAETPSPDSETERAEPADDDDETSDQVDEAEAAPESKKYKLKLNGVEVEKTEEEVLALAQKVGAADLYLSEAAKAYKATQAPKEPESSVEEDDVALARAIQMGSEEEAVNAIRKLKSRSSFKQDDLTRIVDERLTFQDAATRFKAKYPEIMADPDLALLASTKDKQMIDDGDKRSYWERFDEIGQSLQSKFGKQTFSDKQTRKATVTPIRMASSRAETAGDQEPDDNPAAVIAQMAKSRGQR